MPDTRDTRASVSSATYVAFIVTRTFSRMKKDKDGQRAQREGSQKKRREEEEKGKRVRSRKEKG